MQPQLLHRLKQLTAIEKQQQQTHQFVEDMPPFAINQQLSEQQHTRVLNNYFFRDKDIYISRHNRYADYPTHTHTFLELNYMLQGTAHETVEGQSVTLYPGDLILLDSGSTHSIQALGDDDLLINILFRTKTINLNLLNDLRRSNSVLYDFLLNNVTGKPTAHQDYLIFRRQPDLAIQDTLNRIITEYYQKRDFANSMLQAYLSVLIIQLIREYPLNRTHPTSKRQSLAIKLLTDITNEYQTVTLATLADRYNYNKNYLSNVFKAEVGKTFSTVLTQQRLIQAQILITSTALPIQEIMHQVGMTNKTFFYQKYKAYYHTTPSNKR